MIIIVVVTMMMAMMMMLVPASLLLIVGRLVELGLEVEGGGGGGQAVSGVRRADLLVLAILTIDRAHAPATATPRSRRLRVYLLLGPATRIRFRATRRPVTLRIQHLVLLEAGVSCHSRERRLSLLLFLSLARSLSLSLSLFSTYVYIYTRYIYIYTILNA